MVKKIKVYFEALEGLSTKALDQSVENLVREEKRNVALVIAHIAEISRRKAELECGYKNIFDYCVKRLKLSEGSVARRLQVANVARRFPQLLMALADNRISLTVSGLLAPHLTEDNVDKLLSECAGMTKREVEEYLVTLKPKPVFRPSIRKRPSSGKNNNEPPAEEKRRERRSEEESKPPSSTSSVAETQSPHPPTPSPNLLEPAKPDLFNFRFSADETFKDKFERLAEVLGVENPLMNMAEIFERAVDISLEKKDPKKKHERRLARKRKQNVRTEKSSPGKILKKGPTSGGNGKSNSRYIPSEVRERVFERAGHQCEYKARDGTRCSSKTGLEIEHERPFAIYRSHEERHLKVLCRRHNRFMAERVYGTKFIQAKIDANRHANTTRA